MITSDNPSTKSPRSLNATCTSMPETETPPSWRASLTDEAAPPFKAERERGGEREREGNYK